jgi:hypothetical protein
MDRSRYRERLEGLPPYEQDRAWGMARRLVTFEGLTIDQAVDEAARYFQSDRREEVPRVDEALAADPDFSLGHPHGPEGESHGGRGGLDPLQYAHDLAPEVPVRKTASVESAAS